uniref:CCHC-type domain-containing protein n=1 Tax=Tanacetum cinerariifolium TaxID=118510 RepID=A0A6L2MFW9_TANCI|nr:hypothetical protein [Tanacetum cinerariifolium]
MILELVKNGPLIWPTIEENGVTRTKKCAKLYAAEKIQAACDMKATNIILQGDDPIACLNKAMDFLTAVASSRVIVQQVQRRQGQSYSGTGYKSNATSSRRTMQVDRRVVRCYNCQGERHMARQCTQPKRPRNTTWYKDKAMLAEAEEAGKILDEEQLTEDLDTYDSDCDDISNAKAVLMDNISNYGSDIISDVPHSKTYLNDMENQRMFKLDLDPLALKLLQNREARIDYLKYTHEQADVLRGIVKQAKAKQPLDNTLDFASNVMPPKKTTSHSVETQKPDLKVYSRKPKNVKNVGSSKNAKSVESKNTNHSEPNHTGDPMLQILYRLLLLT